MELNDFHFTADLARLGMSAQELQEFFPSFEQMISLFDTMQAADADSAFQAVSGPCVKAGRPESFFRADADTPKSDEALTEAMLAQAGERDGRFVVIPNVL